MSGPHWTPGTWEPGRPDMLNAHFERGFGKHVYADDDSRGGLHHIDGEPLPLPVAEALAPDAEECLANAHLIAAAPDLYEALESLNAAMLEIQQAVYDELVGDAGTTLAKAAAHAAKWHYRKVAAQTRAALAKARGGEEVSS